MKPRLSPSPSQSPSPLASPSLDPHPRLSRAPSGTSDVMRSRPSSPSHPPIHSPSLLGPSPRPSVHNSPLPLLQQIVATKTASYPRPTSALNSPSRLASPRASPSPGGGGGSPSMIFSFGKYDTSSMKDSITSSYGAAVGAVQEGTDAATDHFREVEDNIVAQRNNRQFQLIYTHHMDEITMAQEEANKWRQKLEGAEKERNEMQTSLDKADAELNHLNASIALNRGIIADMVVRLADARAAREQKKRDLEAEIAACLVVKVDTSEADAAAQAAQAAARAIAYALELRNQISKPSSGLRLRPRSRAIAPSLNATPLNSSRPSSRLPSRRNSIVSPPSNSPSKPPSLLLSSFPHPRSRSRQMSRPVSPDSSNPRSSSISSSARKPNLAPERPASRLFLAT